MSEWPEALIEKVAKAIYIKERQAIDPGWPAWGDLEDMDAEGRKGVMETAVAALDALGLRVSEEFRVSYSYGVNSGQLIGWDVQSMVERQQEWTFGPINVDKVERRDNLNAVTDWEDV